MILSKKQKSYIYGAQYLHMPIPGLSSQAPAGQIRTIRVGEAAGYAQRVYGNAQHVTSWAKVRPLADAWDLRKTYEAAWEKFKDNIADVTLGPHDIEEYTASFDLVISTIPLWSICQNPKEHRFNSIPILVKKDIGPEEVIKTRHPNWVVYNGSTGPADWYRASSIFGHTSVEARSIPTLMNKAKWESGFKVVSTNCTCHPNVVRAGRMGKWTGGVLTHHAFETTIEIMSEQFGTISATPLS